MYDSFPSSPRSFPSILQPPETVLSTPSPVEMVAAFLRHGDVTDRKIAIMEKMR
jgi:hypothetical protein